MDKITVYHLLHGQPLGKVIGSKSEGEDSYSFNLPGESLEHRIIRKGESDDLFPLVFEGDLIFYILPFGSELIRTERQGTISCQTSLMRKMNSAFPWKATPDYIKKLGKTELALYRHFMLLPTNCKILVCRFDERLDVNYGTIVFRTDPEIETVAEWRPVFV